MAWDSINSGVSHVIATYMKYQNMYSRIKSSDSTNKLGGLAKTGATEKAIRGTPSVIVEISAAARAHMAGDKTVHTPLTYSALRA
jgi:hypothetical protein